MKEDKFVVGILLFDRFLVGECAPMTSDLGHAARVSGRVSVHFTFDDADIVKNAE